ncbi:MAG: hypothetical protein ACE5FS_08360 [Paracoccaceae bacterium]
MRRTIIALVLVLGTAFGQSARAQAPFQTEIGRLCLEAWITRALQQLNSYSGTTSNGVTSADYGAWQGAMEFPR